ncbi:MAG: hypothetical protein CMK83_10325 [Pseudomonadales bacterium]|nr:hypothetical protein [Pseudomonadales bacterium]MEC8814022.1 hypothetical protein [Pseudomonadota bacterium]HCE77060.1 hypothetical protein [Dehalococcoidia bacterium]|tara:strand:- start:755 stop:1924 length:1170 start_codon:yes stop_codon:yes gene_type:complete
MNTINCKIATFLTSIGFHNSDVSHILPDNSSAEAIAIDGMENFCSFHKTIWSRISAPFSFQSLPLLARGQSKEVRMVNDQYVAIKYIPSLSSHTHSRFGMIAGTESLRMDMTTELFSYLDVKGIDNLFVTRIDDYLVFKTVCSPQLIEVIFKFYHSGTPVWRYHGIDKSVCRDGSTIEVEEPYPNSPIIRFDWRNPASVAFKIPQNSVIKLSEILGDVVTIEKRESEYYAKINQDKEPEYKAAILRHKEELGPDIYRVLDMNHFLHDEVLPDDLANCFIDVGEAKQLAQYSVYHVKSLLLQSGYELWDGCINITDDGKSLYGELSFDCLRIRRLNSSGSQECYDKDLWRHGVDEEIILKRYAKLVSDVQANIMIFLSGEHGCSDCALAV